MHGKQSNIHIANGSPIFKGLPPIIRAARYHSLIAKRCTLPDELLVIAEDDTGEVMAVSIKNMKSTACNFIPSLF
jgi:anthranilate synthase component 2